VALHAYLEDRRVKWLVVACACWVLNGLTSGYFLMYFAVLAGLWVLWFGRSLKDWLAIGGTFAAGSLFLAPFLLGYRRYQSALGLARDPGEIDGFSADLSAVWATIPNLWPSLWTVASRPEGQLYPGAVIFVLALTGAVLLWLRAPRHSRWPARLVVVASVLAVAALSAYLVGGWRVSVLGVEISLRRWPRVAWASVACFVAAGVLDSRSRECWRRRSPLFFYSIAAVAMVAFALGPTARLFGTTFLETTPYDALMALPGGQALRVPARFATLFILCLAVAAALAFRRLVPPGRSKLLAGVLGVAIAGEGWMRQFPVAPVLGAMAYAQSGDPGVALYEIPVTTLEDETAAMLRATVHGHALVNGYSGYGPPHYGPLSEGARLGDPSVFGALRRFGDLLVVVNRQRDERGSYARFVASAPDAELVFRSPMGPVFRFPAEPSPLRRADDVLLSIRSLDADPNPGLVGVLTDEDTTTQWQTDGPQLPGAQVVVEFDGAVDVSRVEMDLGTAPMNYPRGLRVEVAATGAPPVVAYEGGTAGAAVLALLADHRRAPLTIDLPGRPRGQRLLLTLTEADPTYFWSMVELRVYGRAVTGLESDAP
jgi:hypothetical protein